MIEKTFKRLDEIVELLDNEKEVENMLVLYEEGMQLIANARKTLENAKLRISQYGVKEDND